MLLKSTTTLAIISNKDIHVSTVKWEAKPNKTQERDNIGSVQTLHKAISDSATHIVFQGSKYVGTVLINKNRN